MARKSKAAANGTAAGTPRGVFFLEQTAPWGGFLNVRLDEALKLEFFAWREENHQAWWQQLDDFLGEGGKVSCAYDRENQAYIVTLTGALVLGSNERYCSTSRAGTLDEAFSLAFWKHVCLAEGDYSDFKPRTGAFKQWG